jgi:uncharacterized membrane protein YbhN (UPF0104 family)
MKFKSLLTAGIIGAIIFFFAKALWMQKDQLINISVSIQYSSLAISLLFLLGGFVFLAIGWRSLLDAFGKQISLARAIKFFGYAEITKYIPGAIWPTVSKSVAINNSSQGILAALYDAAFKVIVCAIIIVCLAFKELSELLSFPGTLLLCIILLAGSTPVVATKVIELMQTYFDKKTKKVNISVKKYLFALSPYVVAWLLFGTGFFFFLQGISITFPFLQATSYFLIAWLIGFIVVFVPGGIGVREGVLVLLLTPLLGQPIAIIVSVLSRIWWMVGDALLLAVSTIMQRIDK